MIRPLPLRHRPRPVFILCNALTVLTTGMVLSLLLSTACAQAPGDAEARLSKLESHVADLQERQHRLEADQQALRDDLRSLVTYVNLAMDKLAEAKEAQDGSAEEHARKALEKSLEELRQAGKQLLDELGRQLDPQQ